MRWHRPSRPTGGRWPARARRRSRTAPLKPLKIPGFRQTRAGPAQRAPLGAAAVGASSHASEHSTLGARVGRRVTVTASRLLRHGVRRRARDVRPIVTRHAASNTAHPAAERWSVRAARRAYVPAPSLRRVIGRHDRGDSAERDRSGRTAWARPRPQGPTCMGGNAGAHDAGVRDAPPRRYTIRASALRCTRPPCTDDVRMPVGRSPHATPMRLGRRLTRPHRPREVRSCAAPPPPAASHAVDVDRRSDGSRESSDWIGVEGSPARRSAWHPTHDGVERTSRAGSWPRMVS